MGLAEFQHLLARLYTDRDLRQRFHADPRAVAGEFGLDETDVARLRDLSSRQVSQFADSLLAKRCNEVEKLLPWIHRALGPARFSSLFQHHAAHFLPTGNKKHREDALQFVALLERQLGVEPPWLIDLARLEAAIVTAHTPARRLVMRWLRYAPRDLALIGSLNPNASLSRRPTLCMWFRARRFGRVHAIQFSLPNLRPVRAIADTA